MTPLFCDAVKTGKMKADAVQRENGGGMEDLLHSLLVHNDDGISTGIGLSNNAFRLGQMVRQSDEWLALAKAITEVFTQQAKQEAAGSSSQPETTERLDRGGRPRKDDERKKVAELRSQGKTWTQVAMQMNRETGQGKSKDAYRNLLRSGKP
jgi:hypothetical protein